MILSPLIDYFFVSKKMKLVGSYEGAYQKSVYLTFSTTALVGTQYYFPPDNILNSDNNKINSICLTDTITNSIAPTTPATDPLTVAQAAQGYLCICNMKREILATLALTTLIRRLNAGKPTYLNFKDPVVWQNCFIQFENLTTAVNQTHSVWLTVSYSPEI